MRASRSRPLRTTRLPNVARPPSTEITSLRSCAIWTHSIAPTERKMQRLAAPHQPRKPTLRDAYHSWPVDISGAGSSEAPQVRHHRTEAKKSDGDRCDACSRTMTMRAHCSRANDCAHGAHMKRLLRSETW